MTYQEDAALFYLCSRVFYLSNFVLDWPKNDYLCYKHYKELLAYTTSAHVLENDYNGVEEPLNNSTILFPLVYKVLDSTNLRLLYYLHVNRWWYESPERVVENIFVPELIDPSTRVSYFVFNPALYMIGSTNVAPSKKDPRKQIRSIKVIGK